VLSTSLDGLGSTLVAINGDDAIWILFSDMSLVRKMVLEILRNRLDGKI